MFLKRMKIAAIDDILIYYLFLKMWFWENIHIFFNKILKRLCIKSISSNFGLFIDKIISSCWVVEYVIHNSMHFNIFNSKTISYQIPVKKIFHKIEKLSIIKKLQLLLRDISPLLLPEKKGTKLCDKCILYNARKMSIYFFKPQLDVFYFRGFTYFKTFKKIFLSVSHADNECLSFMICPYFIYI